MEGIEAAPEPPQTHEEVAALSFPKPYMKDWKPPDKVGALLRSQATHQAWLDRISAKVKPKARIPVENSWGETYAAISHCQYDAEVVCQASGPSPSSAARG